MGSEGGDLAAGGLSTERRVGQARLADPLDVLALRLTTELKIKVLEQWRYDVRELQVGGAGRRARRAELLQRIDEALAILARAAAEPSGPG